MRPHRGRLTAFVTLSLAGVVAGVALWRPALEAWYLARLESEDAEIRAAAAQMLGRLECYRAIPKLLRELSRDDADGEPVSDALQELRGPRSKPYLLQSLGDEDDEVRYRAMRLLAALIEQTPFTLADLSKPLADPSSEIRELAISALDDALGLKAVPPLEAALEDPSADVRLAALMQLQIMGPLAASATRGVVTLLGDPDDELKGQCLRTLDSIGGDPALEAVKLLGSDDTRLRLAAIELLQGPFRPAGGPVPVLIRALDDPEADVRFAAAQALICIAPTDQNVVIAFRRKVATDAGELEEMLRGHLESIQPETLLGLLLAIPCRDPGLRAGARAALESTLEAAGDTLAGKWLLFAELSTDLASGDSDRVLSALLRLAGQGPWAAAAVPAVERALRSSDPFIRFHAVLALLIIDPEAATRLAPLVEAVEQRSELAVTAVFFLGEAGPRARAAVPTLVKAFDAPDLRTRCLEALRKIDLQALTRLWDRLDDEERQMVLEGLETAPPDRSLVPFLTGFLAEIEGESVNATIAALTRLGPDASEAIPALQKVLEQEVVRAGCVIEKGDPEARDRALGALKSIGKQAVPALLHALAREKKAWRRRALIDALGEIGPDAAEAVPTLLEFLERRPLHLQVAAARALRRIGGPAVEGLWAALEHPSEEVRRLAGHALGINLSPAE